MATVEKRAQAYIKKTGTSANVVGMKIKQPSRAGNPDATVRALNQGILKGPTTRG